MWHPGHLSIRADPGILLQHAWTRFFSTSLSYSHSRYAHSCHTRIGIRCALCSKGRASWLPQLWVSDDCVQRQDDFCFLRASRWLGQSSIYTMFVVMTFVLHPLSHYNSITEPRAQFLLSLLEHLTIDFPSHFILSIIDVYKDMATHDKLIFPSTITRILCHFFVPFP